MHVQPITCIRITLMNAPAEGWTVCVLQMDLLGAVKAHVHIHTQVDIHVLRWILWKLSRRMYIYTRRWIYMY